MKRIISILLAVLLIASCSVAASAIGWPSTDVMTAKEALDAFELDYGYRPETYRYYFLMPNGSNGEIGDDPNGSLGKYAPTWYIEMKDGSIATETAGIYWWSGSAMPDAWIGYYADGTDENDPDVFYADVPTDVVTIIWNNGVDGGTDTNEEIYYCAAQIIDLPSQYYDPGESDNYPDGTESFNNMIFVIDPDLVSINEFSQKQTCGGEWYYYYGNGCYGFTENGTTADCLRDDHYDENGNHIDNGGSVEPSYVLGDANGDGEVTIKDALAIQRVLAEIITWNSETAELAADYNKDGEVTIKDVLAIQKMLVA